MEIKVKYHREGMEVLEHTDRGDWIDLYSTYIEEWKRAKGNEWASVFSNEEAKDRFNQDKFSKGVPFKYKAGDVIKIDLGVSIQLPKGHEAELKPRSSTFRHTGLLQTNSVGAIDESYCGDGDRWGVEFYATRDGEIQQDQRLVQFRIVEKQPKITFKKVDTLGNEDRGGFGTSGK